MLQSISLRFTETGPISLPTKGITVFVGPNNAGKSLVLREIEQVFNIHPPPTGLRILSDYEVEWPTVDAVNATIERSKTVQPPGSPTGHIVIGRFNPGGARENRT